MIHELRCYTAKPGQKKKLMDRFHQGTFGLFEKHGFLLQYFWDRPSSDECWYILEWRSLDHMREGWEGFKVDERWKALKAASEAEGPLVENITSTVLHPMEVPGARK